jgi:hypothetical protein
MNNGFGNRFSLNNMYLDEENKNTDKQKSTDIIQRQWGRSYRVSETKALSFHWIPGEGKKTIVNQNVYKKYIGKKTCKCKAIRVQIRQISMAKWKK